MPNSGEYREKLLALVDADMLEKLRRYKNDFLDRLDAAYEEEEIELRKNEKVLFDALKQCEKDKRIAKLKYAGVQLLKGSIIGALARADLTTAITFDSPSEFGLKDFDEYKKELEKLRDELPALYARIASIRSSVQNMRFSTGNDALDAAICAGVIAAAVEEKGGMGVDAFLKKLRRAYGLRDKDPDRTNKRDATTDQVLGRVAADFASYAAENDLSGSMEALRVVVTDFLRETDLEDLCEQAEALLRRDSMDCAALSGTEDRLHELKIADREDVRELSDRLHAQLMKANAHKACEQARDLMAQNTVEACTEAISLLNPHYMQPEAAKLSEEAEALRKQLRKKRVVTVLAWTFAILLLLFITWAYIFRIKPGRLYSSGMDYMESGDWKRAEEIFTELKKEKYKDSSTKLKEAKYGHACAMLAKGNYDGARSLFRELGDFKDSAKKIGKVDEAEKRSEYVRAESRLKKGSYDSALEIFQELGDYGDAKERIREVHYLKGLKYIEEAGYETALDELEQAGDFKDAKERADEIRSIYYERAAAALAANDRRSALWNFRLAGGYKDAAAQAARLTEIVTVYDDALYALRSDGDVVAARGTGADADAAEFHDVDLLTSINRNAVVVDKTGHARCAVSSISELLDESYWGDIISISASQHKIAGLRSNGTVRVLKPQNKNHGTVLPWKNVVKVMCADDDILAILADGTVVAHDDNKYITSKEVGSLRGVADITFDREGYAALLYNGTVCCGGHIGDFSYSYAKDCKDIVSVGLDGSHIFALTADGCVLEHGVKGSARTPNLLSDEWHDIVALYSGWQQLIGVRADGAVLYARTNVSAPDIDTSGLKLW